jgi:hypothetical protein
MPAAPHAFCERKMTVTRFICEITLNAGEAQAVECFAVAAPDIPSAMKAAEQRVDALLSRIEPGATGAVGINLTYPAQDDEWLAAGGDLNA